MAIHEYYGVFYGMSRREARESWQTASVFEKQSSRNLALHMPLKLFSIGYRLLDGTGESDFKEFAEKNPATIQNLAYGEHLRWSASFYVRRLAGR